MDKNALNEEELSKISGGVMYFEGSEEYTKLQNRVCIKCGGEIVFAYNFGYDCYKCKNEKCDQYYAFYEYEGQKRWQC